MSRTGLGRFGIVPPTVVRGPTTDHEDVRICAKCGHPVETTKGPHHVRKPTLVDDDLAVAFAGEDLIVYGWRCTYHQADVVMPLSISGPDARSLPAGWEGVRLEFADGRVRHVPTPEREERERVE